MHFTLFHGYDLEVDPAKLVSTGTTKFKFHSSDGILLSASTSDHPDYPVTPPGLCVRSKEGRSCDRIRQRLRRKGGRRCERVSKLELSTSMEPLTIEGPFGKGQGQMQVRVCISACIYPRAPKSSLKRKEIVALFHQKYSL